MVLCAESATQVRPEEEPGCDKVGIMEGARSVVAGILLASSALSLNPALDVSEYAHTSVEN